MSTPFRITRFEYAPDDLAAQVPFDGVLVRRMPGADHPDYWLAELRAPLAWHDGGEPRSVTHIVMAARYQGETIRKGFRRLVVGLAYVTDPSLLEDRRLDFGKCRAVAIGVAEGLMAPDRKTRRAPRKHA